MGSCQKSHLAASSTRPLLLNAFDSQYPLEMPWSLARKLSQSRLTLWEGRLPLARTGIGYKYCVLSAHLKQRDHQHHHHQQTIEAAAAAASPSPPSR